MTGNESGAVRGTSRRTLLKGALLAGAGAAAGAASLSRAGTARAATVPSSGTPIAYGAIHSIYPDWVANAPSPDGKNSERRYFDTENYIPTDWTTAMCYSDYVTISIRPNPDDLFNNTIIPDNGSGYLTLDGQITHLLSTCPDHVELTCWHEAQSDNPLNYDTSYITPDNIRKVHAHVQNLCTNTPDADGGRVKYGCILTGPVSTNANYLGSDLDWYGVDIYDNSNFQGPGGNLDQSAISTRMDGNLAAWQSVTSGTVSVRITETNSNEDNHRKNWMLFLSEWMNANNGYRMVTYWGGPDSGTWPPSETVLDYYVTLQSEYGA